MNIELTSREKELLATFAEKQYNGAKDNVGTMTPIHVVERIRTEYTESPDGDAWMWTDGDCEFRAFDYFDDMVAYAKEQTGKDYPPYDEVEYEDVEKDDGETVWISEEADYLEAFGIKAFKVKAFQYTEPVAFFFIRDEAVRYKEGYQKHNCGADCQIYTYGLGYDNKGDLPIFRALLMRMGEMINQAKETQTCVICGQKYEGRGNDARPVKEGRCCNGCNLTVVVPKRIALTKESSNQ